MRVGVRSLVLVVAIPLLAVGVWAAASGGAVGRRASPLLDRVVFDLEQLLPAGSPPAPVSRPRRGGLDVTFLVSADAHFGSGSLPEAVPTFSYCPAEAVPKAE